MQTNRRKRLIVRPGLQLRLVLAIVLGCVMALLLQLLVFTWRMVEFAEEAPIEIDQQLFGLLGTLVKDTFLPTAAIMTAIAAALALTASHDLAGAVYRIKAHLERIARGEDVGPCTLRRGDDLQELCQELNRAAERLKRERTGSAELRQSA